MSVSNQQLFHSSDFVQVGWKALLLPTVIFFFYVHATKPGGRNLAIRPIKNIVFGWGEGSPETRAQPGLVTGIFTLDTNILNAKSYSSASFFPFVVSTTWLVNCFKKS